MSKRLPKDVLTDLDKELADMKWCGPPSDLSHLHDPDHLSVFKELGNFDEIISQWIVNRIATLVSKQGEQEFQICSIGCEDATMDSIVLRKLSKALPDKKFKYTGIAADEQAFEIVEETLELDNLGANITVELLERDYEELTNEGLLPFDFILMANCTYHASALGPMLSGATKLLNPSTGELVIISAARQSLYELITRFYSHQRTYELYTAEMVTATLDKLSIKYTVENETTKFDLTKQFAEGFLSEEASLILDHLVFIKLQDYAPQVAKLCVEFIECISATEEGRRVVRSVSDMIVVSRPG